jgi:hypothetical protein
MKKISRKAGLAAASVALLAPIGVQSVSASALAICPPGGDPDIANCPVLTDRDRVISRANTWLTTGPNGGPVPYSNTDKKGGYRKDCSGYVSMALQLPKGEWGGPNTEALATSTYTRHMASMANLKKGDLVIDPTGGAVAARHVVIFHKWANSAKTSYWAYEQAGDGGTHHRTRTYGLGSDQYDPYRPKVLE